MLLIVPVSVMAQSPTAISFVKTGSPNPVPAGANVTFVITMSLSGQSVAGVDFSDPVPTSTVFASLAPDPHFTCANDPQSNAVACQSNTSASNPLPPGTYTFTLVLQVDAATPPGTQITNDIGDVVIFTTSLVPVTRVPGIVLVGAAVPTSTATATPSPSTTATATPTGTSTATATPTGTSTATTTPSLSHTATATPTGTSTATTLPLATGTPTTPPRATSTATVPGTATSTPSATPTPTSSPTASRTATGTPTSTLTLTAPPSPTAAPSATAVVAPVVVAAAAPPSLSGLPGVPACTGPGETATVTGAASGEITCAGSAAARILALGPPDLAPASIPRLFIPTTVGVESFLCGPVAVRPPFSVTCNGATAGNPLEAGTVTVRVALASGGTRDLTGVVTGAGQRTLATMAGGNMSAPPLLPPLPLVAPPAPLAPPPARAPALDQGARPPGGEVPVIPEAASAPLLLAGLLGVTWLAARPRRR
ncbi:MAG TPA: hypothetical protein VK066_11510 [Chloroflexota bacterium]|nr:hypothetical protein [Chloroflexota bacterium]